MAGSLVHAIHNGRFTQARLLIEQGVDINMRTLTGATPLILALQIPDDNRRRKMFRWLLNMGADSACVDSAHGRDLLSWAAFHNRTQQVAYIMDVDEGLVNVHHRDNYGRTAMHYATMHANTEALACIVRHAVKFGLSVDVKDNDGVTPYLQASLMDSEKCKEVLVTIGHAIPDQLFLTAIDFDDETEDISKRRPKNAAQISFPRINTNSSLTRDSTFALMSARRPRFETKQEDYLPRFMDILSEQSTATFREGVVTRLPLVARSETTATTSSSSLQEDENCLSFVGAATIATFAVNSRKKKQNWPKVKGMKAQLNG